MGAGFHGGFGNTYGARAVSASPVYVGKGKGEELASAAKSINQNRDIRMLSFTEHQIGPMAFLHVSLLAVRPDNLIPCGGCLLDQRDLFVLFVLRQHLSLRGSRTADRTAAAVRLVDFRRGLCDEIDLRRHS